MNFEPVNDLEKALIDASTKPEARPAFYQTLLDSHVFIVPMGEAPPVENGQIKAGAPIQLAMVEMEWTRYTVFFSSSERISQVSDKPMQYLAMGGRDFLKMTRGSPLVMNPSLAYGKIFLPGEVADLLDGKMFEPQVRYTADKDQQIMIGQPAKYPLELMKALSAHYKKYLTVKTASLAHYVNPARDPDPGLLICVDLDDPGQWDKIMGEAGMITSSLHPDHKFVDFFIHDNQPGSVSEYFTKNVKPFYRRGFVTSFSG